ncbi:LytR cell envelope-related transcriptional attenuator [Nocardioides scoriae]|uniref:LytR cell envelope-related transcriptional attenuator n=1 Tax=Nocardioides scoriae TaxID=642780 RepID=A0A1H1UK00_9ACTN|nr:LytR C-terminal domain-containing protein [Nocardioides scoriae]SDS72650.1 LytR cell envelope-related transcriptional attenuator [Nocardioides scoriae]
MNRRHVTTGVTLAVLVVVLGAMAVLGFRAATAPFPGTGSASGDDCTAAEKQTRTTVSRGQVQVSVFNGGTRSGLAGETLQKLEDAGFRGGNAGNAPEGETIRRAVVWTTEPDDTSARLVARAMGKGVPVRIVSQDLGPGVDVIVGDRFRAVDPSAPQKMELPAPVSTCVDVG